MERKLRILEPGIVDYLLRLESDLLNIGQSKGKFGGGQRRVFKQVQKKTMEGNSDLRELPWRDGLPRYYSSQCMSEPYIRILLRKEEDPLLLIAEMVRENSSLYPRPVPIDIFFDSPFDLTQEEILVCLGKMSGQEEYQDIAQTTTSTGTIFLYSSRHLDSGYASMLAEWFDVGQAENP